ncbi:MAG: hypothetical protein O9972_30435 [Burkholderiales bacterium]|jgi:hypothetical protein|nr:hypothetical protein [Burkholderiales bacterium]
MLSDLMKTLDASLASASNRLSFVVTELPRSEDHMSRLLDGAILAANRHRTPLVEIQLSMSRFPVMGTTYWHVPVSDSGDPDVIRLVFEPSEGRQAA